MALRLWETGDPLTLAQSAFATPLSTCPHQCAADEIGNRIRCEECPQREGRTVLAGFGPVVRSKEMRRSEHLSVELTFHLVSTDRRGRHDEWQRIAFDLESKRTVPLLPLDALLRMEPATQVAFDEPAVQDALAHGQERLAPAAKALAAFLRLRSEEDYQRRCDDVQTTYERLLRESGDEADTIHDALQRELTRLADTYAIAVEAQLDSIALISSTTAEVALYDKAGRSVTITTDLGRACVLPLSCTRCGDDLQAGARCAEGHILCAACVQRERGRDVECPICAGIAPAVKQTALVERVPRSGKLTGSEQLRVAQLEAMTPETWQLCATWLLERMGYTTEQIETSEHLSRYSGASSDQQFSAVVMRPPKGVAIGAAEVQYTAAMRAGAPEKQAILLTTAPGSQEAIASAERLGVALIERDSLDELLAQLEAAHTLAVAAEEQAATDRATHAEATRAGLLAELDALEDGLARAVNTRKAGNRAAMVAAVEEISVAQTVSAQVFVAWETLTADWGARFGEHEARDGSLPIEANPEALDEMRERAIHLGEVCRQAFERIRNTPGAGELGYTAWRKAVLEELMARCEALRWRVTAINPAAWRDFAQARDTQALQQAEEAAQAASYAHGRAEKALAQLQTRARIAVPQ